MPSSRCSDLGLGTCYWPIMLTGDGAFSDDGVYATVIDKKTRETWDYGIYIEETCENYAVGE